MRQHGDGVGAGEAGRERRHGRAQHVHVGIALGQHAPRGFRGDEDRLRCKPAGLFDARPQQPQGAEFRHGQELVGVGAEPERHGRAGRFERDAAGFERAQIGDGDSKREGQLLNFRSAGVVNRTAAGQCERSLEAAADQFADDGRERLLHFAPRCRRGAADGHGAQGLIVEANIDLGGIDALGLDEGREVRARISAPEHGIERNRNSGVEDNPVEHPLQRFRPRIRDAKTARARSAGKFKLEPGGAVLEIVQRLRVRFRRLRMIDPLHDLPWKDG